MAASQAVRHGSRFLLAKQGDDGLWHDFLTPAGEASHWPTGYVATALLHAGADRAALDRAAGALLAGQHTDGGWGYHERVPADADSTAGVLLYLAGAGYHGEACRRAASCLVRHQRAAGGIATYAEPGPIRRYLGVGRWMRFNGWCAPHTEVTATAGCALAAGPDGYRPAVDAAWRYVRSRQGADGSWRAYWWTSPHYATYQAVQLALVLGDREPVVHAAEWAARCQADDGTWSAPGTASSAFATALSLLILRAAGVDGRPVDRAVAALTALQDDDGGWPSHPIMRIPVPGDAAPDRHRWLRVQVGRGVVVRDQHRTFTSATCLAALAQI